jgi:predicted RNA-binding protein associated with RNAse of E/G family
VTTGDDTVTIHYRRPPDREEVFTQRLLERRRDCIVTLLEHADLQRPMRIDDVVVLEPGAPVVWLTFPGLWHDIGRFHTRAGEFTGYYANILTPVELTGSATWHTTDLFLDVWLPAHGTPRLLDAAELAGARRAGWLDEPTARRAEAEAAALLAAARAGSWPPAAARDWTLARARRHVRG